MPSIRLSRLRLLTAAFVAALSIPAAQPSAQKADTLITETGIRSHMGFLAGDALNGRGSGTRDEWLAASYLGAQMAQWGLEPLGDDGKFVQQIEIERGETVAPPTLSCAGRRFTHGPDMRIQTLSAARVSGALQKFRPGTPVAEGAVILMPQPPPGAGGTTPSAAATVTPPPGAAAVLTLDVPTARRPGRGLLPTPPARFAGVQ